MENGAPHFIGHYAQKMFHVEHVWFDRTQDLTRRLIP